MTANYLRDSSQDRLIVPLGISLPTCEANKTETSALFGAAFKELELGDPAEIRDIQSTHRIRTYLSCWHKNPIENPEMWKHYTSSPESIAISTTALRLSAALGNSCTLINVQYIDERHSIPELHSMALFAHKRKEFTFEQEARLVHMLPNDEVSYLRLIKG